MWWHWVARWLPHRGGGYRVRVQWGGWLLVVGPRAVRGSWSSLWCSPVRGPCAIVAARGLGSPGVGCVGLECRNRGAWSRGALVCCPTVDLFQGCGERRLWATGGLPRLPGPRAGGLRHTGRVLAPVRRPWVASGCVWPGCIASMVAGGPWARAWGGSVVGCQLVTGAGASLWVGGSS